MRLIAILGLELTLHPDKSQIIPLRNGVTFLGYRVFYHYKLLRKRDMRSSKKKIEKKLALFEKGLLSKKELVESLQGWFGYAQWANTYKIRKSILQKIYQKDF